jgi:hypothetical protein
VRVAFLCAGVSILQTFCVLAHAPECQGLVPWYVQIGLQIAKAHEGRAVLIYFESEAKLQDFRESEYGRKHPAGAMQIITSATRNVSARVRKATHSGSVTLISREQGRGLDYHCSDKTVEQTGGLHVVQTFLSEELSEEIQIRGRTARQKNKGSFELVLLAPDLAKFEIAAEELALKKKGLHVQVAGGGGAFPAAAAAAAAAAAPAAATTPAHHIVFIKTTLLLRTTPTRLATRPHITQTRDLQHIAQCITHVRLLHLYSKIPADRSQQHSRTKSQ